MEVCEGIGVGPAEGQQVLQHQVTADGAGQRERKAASCGARPPTHYMASLERQRGLGVPGCRANLCKCNSFKLGAKNMGGFMLIMPKYVFRCRGPLLRRYQGREPAALLADMAEHARLVWWKSPGWPGLPGSQLLTSGRSRGARCWIMLERTQCERWTASKRCSPTTFTCAKFASHRQCTAQKVQGE